MPEWELRIEMARWYARRHVVVKLAERLIEKTAFGKPPLHPQDLAETNHEALHARTLAAIIVGEVLPSGFIAEKLDEVREGTRGHDPAYAVLDRVAEALGVQVAGGQDG